MENPLTNNLFYIVLLINLHLEYKFYSIVAIICSAMPALHSRYSSQVGQGAGD